MVNFYNVGYIAICLIRINVKQCSCIEWWRTSVLNFVWFYRDLNNNSGGSSQAWHTFISCRY